MKRYLKAFVFLFIFLFSINFVYSQDDELGAYNDGSSRQQESNYGVNKKWKINDSNLSNVLRTPKVDASKKVYDYAGILSSDEEASIKSMIDNYIEHTKMDMVFVTVNMPYSYDDQNEDYAADFYDYNDFGLNYEHYSGVILYRNAYSADPYYGAYFFGEAQLYYGEYRENEVLDDIYADFKSGNYVNGFRVFSSRLTSYYDSGKELDNYYIDDDGMLQREKEKFVPPIGSALIAASITTLIVMLILISKNKMVKKANKAADYLDKTSIQYHDRTDQFLTTVTTSRYNPPSSSSSGGGGGFSSSVGSSGGGHSGGGRHG